MFSDTIPDTKIDKKDLKISNTINDCLVSKASTEIMLNRVCHGEKIEFPFS